MSDGFSDQATQEIARLKTTEVELKNRLYQQEMIARLSQVALASTNVHSLLEEAASLVAGTLSVEYSEILEYIPEKKQLLIVSGIGWRPGVIGEVFVPATMETVAGIAFLTGEPVIISDLKTDTRIPDASLLREHNIESGMSIVIPGKDRSFGVLGVHSRHPRTFSKDDTHFLTGIANILASKIDNINTEEDLVLSHNQLDVILKGVADGILAQDQIGRFVYANPAAVHLMGFSSEEELLSQSIGDVLQKFEIYDSSGSLLSVDQLPARITFSEKQGSSATLRFRDKDTGEEKWLITKSTPIINHEGESELAVSIFQDITENKRAEQAQIFLAEAGGILTGSLEYDTTLRSLAKLAVTNLADWCAIYLVEEDDTVRQLVVEHKDPERLQWALELQQRYPPDPNAQTGVFNVIRTGQAEYYPSITNKMLRESITDDDQYQSALQLFLKGSMVLPLQAHDHILGAIALYWAESGHSYSQIDVRIAEELARRAALALDNARLYREVQDTNASLEQRVAQRTAQLQSLIAKLRAEIQERKRVEEALRENEEMLGSLFESGPDATVLVDSQGDILRANAQVEKYFQIPIQDLIGKSIDTLLPDRYIGRHLDLRALYFSDPETRTISEGVQLFGKRMDGSEFPVDVMLSPVKTENGVQVICAIRDITRRKAMEAELEELQRRLIDNLEAERLRLAQELHDSAIQELYGVSYQLKSLEESLIPKTKAYGDVAAEAGALRTTQESTQHIVNILRTICGELRPPALAPFGLEKAIQSDLDRISQQHPELRIHVQMMNDRQAIPERQRLALFRIYQHALSNVIRHAEAKQIYIRLSLDKQQVVMEIEDDGKGFVLPARWIQLAREGHLGLVGTLERAQAIGGKLQISSTPGKGTLIQVILPLSSGNEGSGTQFVKTPDFDLSNGGTPHFTPINPPSPPHA